MGYFPGRANNQRLWSREMNQELNQIYQKEQRIIDEMEKVVNQAETEVKEFGKFKKFQQEHQVPTGRDVTHDKISKKMEAIGDQARPQNNKGWENLDQQIQKSGFKEQLVKCPGCGDEVRASQGFCSRVCESNFVADEKKYKGSRAEPEPALPTFDDVKYGKAPLSKQQINAGKARAKAKAQVLSSQ